MGAKYGDGLAYTLSFLLLLLNLVVLGVDQFVRHGSGRVGSVFARQRIHNATGGEGDKGRNARVDGLTDRLGMERARRV